MPSINRTSYAILIKALQERDLTYEQMQKLTGLSKGGLVNLTKTFRHYKLMHICELEPDRLGRECIAVFRWGAGKDVRPTRMTSAEKCRLHRERKRKINLHPTSLREYGNQSV